MPKFTRIEADALNHTMTGYDDQGNQYILSDSAIMAWQYFDKLDTGASMKHYDITMMITMLTKFQYHILKKDRDFKGYRPNHNKVMDYIFENYDSLLKKEIVEVNQELELLIRI